MKIQVAKKNGEPRGLCIPTVRDRGGQTAILHRIGPLFERQFEECSFAYRKGRSVRQAVMRIKEYYEQGCRFVVDAVNGEIQTSQFSTLSSLMRSKWLRFPLIRVRSLAMAMAAISRSARASGVPSRSRRARRLPQT
jgi:hypothetical protein